MLHDHASGVVSPGRDERVHIRYRLDRDEYDQLALGLRESARILLAAGAQRVFIPTRPAKWVTRASDLNDFDGSSLGPLNPSLTAVHPMSTLWMGNDRRNSVVDPQGMHHHVQNLWVADGSLFPTSIGGPPQVSIYTFARRVARAIAAAGN
ncbi:MAG: GMC family oxidoreductase [bacterium]